MSYFFLQSTLQFIALTRAEIMQYCVTVLIACLRVRNVSSDIALGHLIVLLQVIYKRFVQTLSSYSSYYFPYCSMIGRIILMSLKKLLKKFVHDHHYHSAISYL